MNLNPAVIAAIVAAVQGNSNGSNANGSQKRTPSPRRRSPSPATAARATFPKNACFHCKSTDHARTPNPKINRKGCPEFAKILKENGGKPPPGYEGAFEKHIKAWKLKNADKKVSAIADEELLQWLAEDSDDDSLDGGMCGAVWQTVAPKCNCHPFEVDSKWPLPDAGPKTSNSFAALADGDSHADSDVSIPMTAAVEKLANDLKSSVHRVTKKSDKKNKSKSFHIETDEDLSKLENLLCGTRHKYSARALRHMQKETELDDVASFVERKSTAAGGPSNVRKVWAMVDSGSFVTIANCAKVSPGHTVRPSAGSIAGVKYSDASGGDIINRGEVTVTHVLEDGTEIDVPFQDGDVKVPIISVKDFVRKGSIVKFKHDGGSIRLPTGTTMRFVEKFGVYFICLTVVDGAYVDGDNNRISAVKLEDADHAAADGADDGVLGRHGKGTNSTARSIDALDRAIQVISDAPTPPSPHPGSRVRRPRKSPVECQVGCRCSSGFTRPVS